MKKRNKLEKNHKKWYNVFIIMVGEQTMGVKFPELAEKKNFICDMDGVIYHGNRLIPHVKEFVEWLESSKKNYLASGSSQGCGSNKVISGSTQQIESFCLESLTIKKHIADNRIS